MIVSRAEKFYEDLLKYRQDHFVDFRVRYHLDVLEPSQFRVTVRAGRRRTTVKPFVLRAARFKSELTFLGLELADDLVYLNIYPPLHAEWKYFRGKPILGDLSVSPEAVDELCRQIDSLAQYFPKTIFGRPTSKVLADARAVSIVQLGGQFEAEVVLDRSSVDIHRMPDGRFQIQEMTNRTSGKGRYEVVDEPARVSDLRRMKEMVLRAFGRVRNEKGQG